MIIPSTHTGDYELFYPLPKTGFFYLLIFFLINVLSYRLEINADVMFYCIITKVKDE